ncbi:hypothetical protein KFE25_003659 [Diacronema lutheri]|uniref:Uncharacterized protein n=2 Tax=Diacronema lutheri TaxID=2081491 RepID=A0A8J6C911_DIALT|nr:hypothetical protein KFE25_003659 [Diacronema lutheri]
MARLAFLVALAAVGADAYAMAGSRRPLVAPRSVVSRTPLVRHGAANTKAVIEGMVPRIIQGATQGAVGAVVAATLSAFTEPVVNRILVQRISVMESIKQLDMAKSRKFFMTTLPTNFLKFPLFEAVNLVMQAVDVPDSIKGLVTGLVFTTLTLPVTNYRFCKSMEIPVDGEALFKAYVPTVLRDVIYGISRNKLNTLFIALYPALKASSAGRAALMFPIVLLSCIISSPGNELRGYYLQPKEKRLGFKAFFQPTNYVRSTVAGALIMATSLGIGTYVTAPVRLAVMAIKAFIMSKFVAA